MRAADMVGAYWGEGVGAGGTGRAGGGQDRFIATVSHELRTRWLRSSGSRVSWPMVSRPTPRGDRRDGRVDLESEPGSCPTGRRSAHGGRAASGNLTISPGRSISSTNAGRSLTRSGSTSTWRSSVTRPRHGPTLCEPGRSCGICSPTPTATEGKTVRRDLQPPQPGLAGGQRRRARRQGHRRRAHL